MKQYLKAKRFLVISHRVSYPISKVGGKIVYKKNVGGKEPCCSIRSFTSKNGRIIR